MVPFLKLYMVHLWIEHTYSSFFLFQPDEAYHRKLVSSAGSTSLDFDQRASCSTRLVVGTGLTTFLPSGVLVTYFPLLQLEPFLIGFISPFLFLLFLLQLLLLRCSGNFGLRCLF